jgi:hypothetical protein
MTPTTIRLAAPSLARLCELLVLFAALRRVRDPISTPATAGRPCQAAEGLRRSIEVVVQSADLVGMDPASTDRLPSILPDPAVLWTLQAFVHCVLGQVETDDPTTSAPLPMPAAEDVALGLPTANQVIAFARRPDQ